MNKQEVIDSMKTGITLEEINTGKVNIHTLDLHEIDMAIARAIFKENPEFIDRLCDDN